jgi:hypothetical protein
MTVFFFLFTALYNYKPVETEIFIFVRSAEQRENILPFF